MNTEQWKLLFHMCNTLGLLYVMFGKKTDLFSLVIVEGIDKRHLCANTTTQVCCHRAMQCNGNAASIPFYKLQNGSIEGWQNILLNLRQ